MRSRYSQSCRAPQRPQRAAGACGRPSRPMRACRPPRQESEAITLLVRRCYLTGTKAWCSGAEVRQSCACDGVARRRARARRRRDGPPVHLDRYHRSGRRVGMQATASADVRFDRTPATLVGPAPCVCAAAGVLAWRRGHCRVLVRRCGADRPHVARRLRTARRSASAGSSRRGRCRAGIRRRRVARNGGAYRRQSFRRRATRGDARTPCRRRSGDCRDDARRRARSAPAPLCRDARFARALADLPVFLRQSHAERDLASLGELVAAAPVTSAHAFMPVKPSIPPRREPRHGRSDIAREVTSSGGSLT